MKASDYPDFLELGHDHVLRLTKLYGHDDIIGGILEHKKPDGSACLGSFAFDVPEYPTSELGDHPRWAVESWQPLTLSPSLECVDCGDHGHIREGRWVPA